MIKNFSLQTDLKKWNTLALLISIIITLGACSGSSENLKSQVAMQQKSMENNFNNFLGVQLWTFRNELESDLPGTLKKIKNLGFTYIEAHNAGYVTKDPKAFKVQIDSVGLEVVGLHWNNMQEWREDPEQIMDVARTIGADYVGIAWLPDEYQEPLIEEDVVEAADILMENCKIAKEKDLKLYYHIHGYEFQPVGEGDKTFFDSFMETIDPSCVSLQLDIFWAVYAGQNPLDLFERYGAAVDMLHLKDMAADVETGVFTGAKFSPPRMPPNYWVPLGAGKIDLKPILQSAQDHQVQWYFLEMDHASNVFDDTHTSLEYLERIDFLQNRSSNGK